MIGRLLKKTIESLRTEGPGETIVKAVRLPFKPYVIRRKERRIFDRRDLEHRFTQIYELNYWGGRESASGVGSHLANTANLRNSLPRLFETYDIKSVFDAPCGDFNWMKHVQQAYPLDYTGADIVAPLVESLNARHGNPKTRFLHLDLTKARFPAADLMICRDCLFHLSWTDTRALLANFVDSGIPYLLTTTHLNRGRIRNHDIETGGFRLIDLFSAPYGFPEDVLFRTPDAREENKETEICLWRRDQIEKSLAGWAAPAT